MNRDWMRWTYRSVSTQNTSTGNSTVEMKANERMIFLWGQLGLDDYAAGRSFQMWLFNDQDELIAVLEQESSVDNQIFPFPVGDVSGSAAGDGPIFQMRIEMGKGEYIQIKSSLLATETLTLALNALIKTTPPTITVTTSAGTITEVVSANKVI